MERFFGFAFTGVQQAGLPRSHDFVQRGADFVPFATTLPWIIAGGFRKANPIVANPGLTMADIVSSRATSIQLKESTNLGKLWQSGVFQRRSFHISSNHPSAAMASNSTQSRRETSQEHATAKDRGFTATGRKKGARGRGRRLEKEAQSLKGSLNAKRRLAGNTGRQKGERVTDQDPHSLCWLGSRPIVRGTGAEPGFVVVSSASSSSLSWSTVPGWPPVVRLEGWRSVAEAKTGTRGVTVEMR